MRGDRALGDVVQHVAARGLTLRWRASIGRPVVAFSISEVLAGRTDAIAVEASSCACVVTLGAAGSATATCTVLERFRSGAERRRRERTRGGRGSPGSHWRRTSRADPASGVRARACAVWITGAAGCVARVCAARGEATFVVPCARRVHSTMGVWELHTSDMSKRDLVREAKEKWERLIPRAERLDHVTPRLYALLGAALLLDEENEERWEHNVVVLVGHVNELRRLISVGLVACIEGYFRIVYRDLVECSPEIRRRLASFEGLTFDLNAYLGLELQNVKLSEFVAHQLPARSIEQINTTMGVLTGRNFLREVKAQIEATKQPTLFPELSADEAPQVLSRLSEMYRLRHHVAHELAVEPVDERGRAYRFASCTLRFLGAAESVAQVCAAETRAGAP